MFDRAGWLILAGLTALAAAMRFYRLGSVPAGLHYDEAFNALDALELIHIPLTDWPIFFEGNSGREPLFLWLSGIAHALFGPSMWTARSVSALSGVLIVPALAWLGWETAPGLGVRNRQLFALWSAAAVLALLWSQIFARIGLRGFLFVLLETMLWAAMWRAWRRPAPVPVAWTVTGILAGISFYTYLPARLLPLIIPLLLVAALFQDRQRLRQHLPGICLGAVAALLVAAPLAIFFFQNPVAFSGRVVQIGVTDWDAIPANISAALKMFVWEGDSRHGNNLAMRPALDPLLALPFLVGVGLSLYRFWRLGRIFLLAGLCIQLLSTLLSDNPPNFLRAIGALPYVALLTAHGAEATVRSVGRLQWRFLRHARSFAWAVFAASIALTIWTYFGVWANSPRIFGSYNVGVSQLVRQIADEREATVYVNTHGGLYNPVLFYQLELQDRTARFYDGQECLPLAMNGAARHLFLAEERLHSRLQVGTHFPEATSPSPLIFDWRGPLWMAEIRQARGGPVDLGEMRPHPVELADGIGLAGYWRSPEVVQAGQPLRLRLFWRVSSRPAVDYTTFIHLVLLEEDGSTVRLAGFDRRPGDGTCPTNRWLPGEVIIDDAVLNMPAELPQRELFLAVGFYSVADGQRLAVADSVDNEILLGPLNSAP